LALRRPMAHHPEAHAREAALLRAEVDLTHGLLKI
jgi:hypothetical protein